MKNFIIVLFIAPIFSFSQCLVGDCEDGVGEYRFKNGIYKGDFADGELSGFGVFSNKKGYVYSGLWTLGSKNGIGEEASKRDQFSYKGNFLNNQRDGYGEAYFSDNKFMKNIHYQGNWTDGAICGEGQLDYTREFKFGRNIVEEQNTLVGTFINGVYQGRMTNPYPDEVLWEPFGLKMDYFEEFKELTDKEYKRLKNPATIEGDMFFSCECVEGYLIFNTGALFRKSFSWWGEGIPTKTKSTILNTRQGEFDIIEWYARELKYELNKEQLPCSNESVSFAWALWKLKTKECRQTRRLYTTETAWNPKKGQLKNKKIQNKWNKKIANKLEKYEKLNLKILEKYRRKISKTESVGCLIFPINPDWIPESIQKTTELKNEEEALHDGELSKAERERIKKEAEKQKKLLEREKIKNEKERKARMIEEKKQRKLAKEEERKRRKELRLLLKQSKKEARRLKRLQRSFVPHFPRSNQLE